MDTNKLLRIIRKDTQELIEMTEDLMGQKKLTRHEIEFALSKSRIVLQELEYLKEINSALGDRDEIETVVKEQPKVEEETVEVPQKSLLEELEEDELEESREELEQELIVEEKKTDKPAEEVPAKKDVLEYTKNEAEEETGIEVEVEVEPKIDKEVKEEKQEESKVDTTPEKDQGKRIGETQFMNKSLNDFLSGASKLEHKLASSPIAKLESAIGLNDRFQYIRELFDNDSQAFQETVKSIDGLDNLDQALSYLDQNFLWEENEASVKFAQLVKRRFSI